MVSLDMKKFLNKTIAIKTATGVAASVTAMTAVNSAMSYAQAQDVVQHHAKEINDRSNVVAKILDIDRSKLVQKNYLKAAQRIDDYLTGVTNELHLDASMFNVDGSIEDESIFGVDKQSNEAFNRLSQQLASSISDGSSNDVDETFDLRKTLKESMTTSQDSNQLLNRVTVRETDKPLSNEHSVNAPDSNSSISEDKRFNSGNQSDSVKTDETRPKESTQSDQSISRNSESSDTKARSNSDYIEDRKTSSASHDELQQDKQTANNRVEDQSSDEGIDHLNVALAVEDYAKSNLSNKDNQHSTLDRHETSETSETSKSDVDLENEKDDTSNREINLSGRAEINVHVRYNNNKSITDFKIVKETTGVRRADGSEVWNAVTFDRSDLPQEFLSDEIWKKADLLNPDFSSSYIPTSSD